MKTFIAFSLLILVVFCQAQDCQPLPANRFRVNINQFQSAASDTDLMERLGPILNQNCLETYQVVKIASLFRNDDQRLLFAQRAYDQVLDPENYYDVFDTFLGMSKAFRLYDYINYSDQPMVELPVVVDVGEVEEPEVVCSLSNKDYNSLIATLKKEPFPMRRLPIAESLIRDRCLSVNQIGGFMDLLSMGKDRVAIAKAAFDNCTEPLEYHRLIDKLSFSSDKEDLLNFIKSR